MWDSLFKAEWHGWGLEGRVDGWRGGYTRNCLKQDFSGIMDIIPFGSQKAFKREYTTLSIENSDSPIGINEMADKVRKK